MATNQLCAKRIALVLVPPLYQFFPVRPPNLLFHIAVLPAKLLLSTSAEVRAQMKTENLVQMPGAHSAIMAATATQPGGWAAVA